MNKKQIREWKKVFEEDLGYIIFELKESLKTPALVILEGDLGAGKTTFVKRFVGDDKILSPTYSVVSEVDNILHADFYRIKTNEEIYHLELELYLEKKSFFFAEWGEKFAHVLERVIPEDYSVYIMDITVNDKIADKHNQPSRNFILSSLEFI